MNMRKLKTPQTPNCLCLFRHETMNQLSAQQASGNELRFSSGVHTYSFAMRTGRHLTDKRNRLLHLKT